MQRTVNVCDFCKKEFNYVSAYTKKIDIKRCAEINHLPVRSIEVVITPRATIGDGFGERTIEIDLCRECIEKIILYEKPKRVIKKR